MRHSNPYPVLFAVLLMACCASAAAAVPTPWQEKVDDRVFEAVDDAPADVLVFLAAQADLDRVAPGPDRRRQICAELQAVAGRTQPAVLAAVRAAGAEARGFWIANVMAVRGADRALIGRLAARDDVARIVRDPQVPLVLPEDRGTAIAAPAVASRTLPWNLTQIGAPDVWATGNGGQGATIGILDTGCDWQHPTVREQYRGWDGAAADHDYNWHDAVHAGSNPCGVDATEPCDDLGHGTHILGAAVGDDGLGTQIGVAPAARWIACRVIVGGWSSPSMFYEGFEWMLAPTPVAGGPGDPDLAPDVVTTAWSCSPAVGCTWDMLLPAVAALREAGIMVVAAAGGGGPGCGTIVHPPAIYDEVATVGSTAPGDIVASFTGRGPVETGQGILVKPDLVAPGVDIFSCLPDDEYAIWSGTADATATVAGVVALVLTAVPELAGDVAAIGARLYATAVALPSDQCGDGEAIPNNVAGYGRVDAWAATHGVAPAPVAGAPAVRLLPVAPNPFNPRAVIRFELQAPMRVRIEVFDSNGRRVRRLVDESYSAGRHTKIWIGDDDSGRRLASGPYFVRLTAGELKLSRRLMLVR